MNVTREVYEQRRQAVADKILAEPDHFNMRFFVGGEPSADPDPVCGTTMCIAGWAALQIPGVRLVRGAVGLVDLIDEDGRFVAMQGAAMDWLDLDDRQADLLFYGKFSKAVAEAEGNFEYEEALAAITPAEAVAALMAAPYACDTDGGES